MRDKLSKFREENEGPIEMLEVLDEKLFLWCKTQQKNSNKLSTEQREELTAMGVQLAPFVDEDSQWNTMFDQLVKYKDDKSSPPQPIEKHQIQKWSGS